MSDYVPVAVVIDISHSKDHDDRIQLQKQTSEAFAIVNTLVSALQSIEPTVGDEFQAVYPDILTALRATLLARLYLPDGVECRFGLGQGSVRPIGEGRIGLIQDGSGWWAAREAVQQARHHEYSRLGFVRTWFLSEATHETADPADDAPHPRTTEALVNAYLVCRDQIVNDMKPRARRILRGLLMNHTQAEVARVEKVTQSAVSQTLHNSGAIALLASEELLAEALA